MRQRERDRARGGCQSSAPTEMFPLVIALQLWMQSYQRSASVELRGMVNAARVVPGQARRGCNAALLRTPTPRLLSLRDASKLADAAQAS